MVTFCLHLQQAGNLHSRTQEDGVKHLFPRVLWKLPCLGKSAHQIGEAKHLVEIRLEPVPDQTRRSLFSLRIRFMLTLQMVVSATSRLPAVSLFWLTK